ncbi:GIY-YIG nuclease family protein [Algoriphagus namhaensis]|uniref:GIY-YIG nuclease family protein n=1 Tax=Algoriphagus namhaensis TaxID=915353 RepID=A0ABV8ASI2_9BACT
MEKESFVYIITNKNNTVLYVGVTSNLNRRIYQHKVKGDPKSFSSKYNLDKLVYFESYNSILEAIEREKQLKAGSRAKKEILIKSVNPEWLDLFDSLS